MKTNVTLKMDVELLREARILAAKQGTSISRMLSETLEEMLDQGVGTQGVDFKGPSTSCCSSIDGLRRPGSL